MRKFYLGRMKKMKVIDLLADCNNISANTTICIFKGTPGYLIWESTMKDVSHELRFCEVDTFTVHTTDVTIYI